MTSTAEPPSGAGARGPGLKLLAVTACPTGIAHTYMAAEKLARTAESLGHSMKVETQGSIGAENVLSDNDVREADGIIIAADKDVDRSRFVGKRVLVVGVAEGIHHPERLIERVRSAPVHRGEGDGNGDGDGDGNGTSGAAGRVPGGSGGKGRGVTYKALMNGVSYMIPFVVVGGLLIAVSLALGGDTTSKGIVIPDDSFWKSVNDIGVIGFQLMIPILSGYIAYAIADRPALVPGMVGGWIAAHGELYDSEAGAGFIGAIVTGFLAGYLVRWIKKVKVPKFVQPIMPIIVIPIVATTALGLFFIYVLGEPIAWVFEHLTDWLGGLTGTSAALLGVILGLMIAFDMGGPVNKTAFLFGAGLVSKNPEVMGMCAAAIPVPPLGQGLATLIRRRMFDDQERETGLAALFMGFFGITEGAIPFAAARPARVIPANMLGGAVAGAVAGLASVEDNVPHGGPIVAVLGAVDGVAMFFVAVIVGTAVTGLGTIALMSLGRDGGGSGAVSPAPAGARVPAPTSEPVLAGAAGGAGGGTGGTAASAAAGTKTAVVPTPTASPEAEPGVRPEAERTAVAGLVGQADAGADDEAEGGPQARPAAGAPARTGTGTGVEGGPGSKAEPDADREGLTAGGEAAETAAGSGSGAEGASEAAVEAGQAGPGGTSGVGGTPDSGVAKAAGAGGAGAGSQADGHTDSVGTGGTPLDGTAETASGSRSDGDAEADGHGGTGRTPLDGTAKAMAGSGSGAGAGVDGRVGSGGAGRTAGGVDAAGGPVAAAEGGSGGGSVLSGYLTERTVAERLTAGGKDAAIRAMAALLTGTGQVTDADGLVTAALAREAQGTTGLGEEIAIPHAKTDAVTAPLVGFARSEEGVEWGAPDGTKARLIFMIAVPEAAAGDEHLRILALLSRKLMSPEFRERLLTAPDKPSILEVLGEIQ
ncbi:fructose-specific PTS transporter subunit EIIC [Streptomyces sp. HD1123-B1]|uniref:fructose-specific PTS transporter subunit EIIC n=1 Tax=Streptomyces huangiella TaxID=3228804 RepID=UPI003D7E5516